MRAFLSFCVFRLLLPVLFGGGLTTAAAPAPLADSLARRRTQAPDSARLRLLLADANAVRAADPGLARQLAEQALRRATAARLPAQEQAAQLLLGRLANAAGDFAAARRYLLRSLRLAEQRADTLGQGGALLGLTTSYKNLQQYAVGMQQVRRAQALLAPLAARPGNPRAAKALAMAYNNSGTLLLEQNQYPAARADFLISLRRSRALGDSGVAVLALYNLGGLALKQKQGAPAYAYYRQTLAIDQAEGNVQGQGESGLNLGDALALLGRPTEAAAAYGQALRFARQAQALPLVRVVYNGFATLYEQTGQPAKALAWQKRFQALNDSLFQTESTRQVAEMQTKYDTEKKDAENRLQAAQLRAQQQVIRRRTTLLGAGALVAALLAGLAYLLYNRRRLRREVEFAQEREQLGQQRAAAVLEAEEAERRRIGADLHDGVGQLLSVVKLNVNALCEELRSRLTDAECHRFGDALDLVDESVGEVRSISHNLLPNALIKRGLARAVREFLDKIQQAGRLRIQLETLGLDEPRLDPAVESALYRVIQEVVQNIVKHAKASEITLQLIRHEGELTLLVEDNGVGFDPAALGPDAGIGLRNIESRVAYLGGVLELDSRPGHGTTVTATVPLTA